MRRIRGVDVSLYQNLTEEIVQALVEEDEVRFAYVRCAVGTTARRDARFRANVELFKRYGVPVGPYFFPYPLPGLDPVAQARLHVSLAEGLGTSIGELAPMKDYEWPPRETRLKDGTIEQTWKKFGCSAPQIRGWLEAYDEEVDRLSGCDGPAYTYPYWAECVEMWRSPRLTSRPLVLAWYPLKGIVPTDEQLARVPVTRGWDRITIVQHDGDGGLRLPVSGGDVDFDVMLDPADLDRLTGQPREPERTTQADLEALASLAHAGAAGLIAEDEIARYRRERIEQAT